MIDLDRDSLDRLLPTAAGAPDWDDVMSRSRAVREPSSAASRRVRGSRARRGRCNRVRVRHGA